MAPAQFEIEVSDRVQSEKHTHYSKSTFGKGSVRKKEISREKRLEKKKDMCKKKLYLSFDVNKENRQKTLLNRHYTNKQGINGRKYRVYF